MCFLSVSPGGSGSTLGLMAVVLSCDLLSTADWLREVDVFLL